MLHHISLGARNIESAARFYDAALAPLGYVRVWSDLRAGEEGQAVGYGREGSDDKLAIKQVAAALPNIPGFHLAFTAATQAAVVVFYEAALSAGGKDNGAPGLRPDYGENYFAAFVTDPDGHHLEAVCKSGSSPLRKIGQTLIQPTHRASCHCGGVVLELDLPEGVVDARRCTCSMCRRKGAIMGAVALDGLRIIQGQDLLSVYRFNSKTAEHYFCSRCGIYTHHRRRSKPNQYGYNLGCLEGVDPNLVQEVPVSDGVNHPADRIANLQPRS